MKSLKVEKYNVTKENSNYIQFFNLIQLFRNNV